MFILTLTMKYKCKQKCNFITLLSNVCFTVLFINQLGCFWFAVIVLVQNNAEEKYPYIFIFLHTCKYFSRIHSK